MTHGHTLRKQKESGLHLGVSLSTQKIVPSLCVLAEDRRENLRGHNVCLCEFLSASNTLEFNRGAHLYSTFLFKTLCATILIRQAITHERKTNTICFKVFSMLKIPVFH